MSYLSIKKNNLKTFFCSNCDELMNKGAFSIVKDSKLKILCQKCCCSELTIEEQKEVKTKESHQEISECIEIIEKTVRKTRNPQPILKREQQIPLMCEVCEEENKQQKKQAEVYCLNDETMFCYECFEQHHKTKVNRKHKTKSIEQWKKENQNSNKKEEEGYFCFKHNSIEPIFCVDDSQMFCSGCSLNEHVNHRVKPIKNRSEEEKQRINIEQSSKSFQKRKQEFVEIEYQLINMIEMFEQQKKECIGMVNEIKETTVSLRESIEHWGQIENEVDDKEWCKREFVERVKSQIERVGQKWLDREKEMRKRTRQILERIDSKTNDTLDKFLSQTERDERVKRKENKEKERRKIIERDLIEEQKKEREREEEKQSIEQQNIEKKQQKKEMIERMNNNISEGSESERLKIERLGMEPWEDSSIINKKEEAQFLNQCLREIGMNTIKIKKIFQGSHHSFSCEQFHKLCDGKGKTILIVESTNFSKFGAFSNVPWNSIGGYSTDREQKSFLFNIVQKQKFFLKKGRTQYSIYGYSMFGPTFGGGHDFHLSNKCNLNNNSYSIPHSYSLSSDLSLVGSKNFKVKEYEVWLVL